MLRRSCAQSNLAAVQRDLTEEGVEPHPDPQKAARHVRKAHRIIPALLIWQFDVASFQLRGWELLETAEACKVAVVVLQETRITCDEASRLNHNLRNGSLFQQQKAPRQRPASTEGGVAKAASGPTSTRCVRTWLLWPLRKLLLNTILSQTRLMFRQWGLPHAAHLG